MPDELARWAARRAPDVLARAEAEAVEELKRALLEAALRGTSRRDRREPQRAEPKAAQPAPAGDALWAYCVTRASDAPA